MLDATFRSAPIALEQSARAGPCLGIAAESFGRYAAPTQCGDHPMFIDAGRQTQRQMQTVIIFGPPVLARQIIDARRLKIDAIMRG